MLGQVSLRFFASLVEIRVLLGRGGGGPAGIGPQRACRHWRTADIEGPEP